MSDISTLFEMLTAGPRRQLLVTLCDVESVQVPEGLSRRGATQTTASTATASIGETGSSERSNRELEWYHNHLPKLQAADLIEWDRETGTVTHGEAFEEIEPAIRLLATNQDVLPGKFF